MPIKPLGAFILTKEVKIDESENKVNGIIITNKDEKDFKVVKVLDWGDVEHPHRYSEGQKLMVSKYAGRNIEHDKERFVLIDEKEIYAEIVD